MSRDPRYDILFQPVRIGPVQAPNRFYQVPHCNGTGDHSPRAVAAMRGMKAAGGWGVVCTETAEISNASEFWPYPSLRLWSDADIKRQAMMAEAVHANGSLAGIELGHLGLASGNGFTRLPPLGPSSVMTLESTFPVQARAMDKSDIRELRHQHRAAALRAREAGFDVVYVYASHNLTVASHFLLRRFNQRSDEYGGSLENRARLLRELIEDTREAIGDRCAVAVRLAVDELLGPDGMCSEGEGREVVEMLAELPDIWDVNISDWSNDSGSSRFVKEGFQEPFIAFVKGVTTKPVVGVGRFTSPDTMASQVKRGILDFIGAARPSIADPFLPRKIQEGRVEDIRECIGCNVCVSGEMSYSPIRCTQNPTIMEEWRRNWHPERSRPRDSEDRYLVVGAGPAGLECALALGWRGYNVILAEKRNEFGGRVTLESRLPGLSEWARVRDYRIHQIGKLAAVETYLDSNMTVGDVLETGVDHVVIATGASWRCDGIGRTHFRPIPGSGLPHVYGGDAIFVETVISGPAVVYDDDGTYLGSAIAERLRMVGHSVTLVTPHADVARWTAYTLEQHKIRERLVELGIGIVTHAVLSAILADSVRLVHGNSSKISELSAASVILLTSRQPNDALYRDLEEAGDERDLAGIKTVMRIGDCLSPNLIAAAVFSGRRYAEETGLMINRDLACSREIVSDVID
jgi:dimethylamine/trimethylamine dehydrogenase